MFVSTRLKTQGAVFTALSLLALAACEDPEQLTSLRPDGDPEVLAVLVLADTVDFGPLEVATFCKQNDPKRPGVLGVTAVGAQVRVCDIDLSRGAGPLDDNGTPVDPTDDVFTAGTVDNANPMGWSIRIMFDELLDPDTAETLEPIFDPDTMEDTGQSTASLAKTQPVTLTCGGVAVPYDGYYSPSGNSVSWPVGPSLVVTPLDPSVVATGAECEISITPGPSGKELTDKEGNPVPASQRGPFSFQISALAFAGTDPESPAPNKPPSTIDPGAPLLVFFNSFIDAASLTPAEVEILEVADCAATTGTARTAVIAANADDPTALEISMTPTVPTGLAWTPEKFYLVTFSDDAEVTDLAGGTATDLAGESVCFATDTAS
ncbi:MAG: hypothetical protein WKG01_09190 [Kofleriaceae bacterium]